MYTQQFMDVMRFVTKWEGGYSHHPSDPGGETKYGISKRSHPNEDIANLSLERALEIYHESYWRNIEGDSRPFPEALAIMDFAVNSGTSRAKQFWADANGDVAIYVAARMAFIASLSTFPTFGRGWVRRIEDLRKVLRERASDVGLIQFYYRGEEFNFRPTKVTVGRTNHGMTKVMARLD